MLAMRAEKFIGYEGLMLADIPKPAVTDGKVPVRMTAAGVTPLECTILSGQCSAQRRRRCLAAKERA